ncbi:hydrogenase 1, small subunit [Escherichia coli]|uniref:hydrogenase (acceptor) n=1 Tax=Escherichia coli TaxID=562 RepID=A0A376TJH5_ECOLX|nr:hydrogenase 1, small subunit [Escherichia coli]
MAAAGTQAEEVFEDIITQYNGKYILAVEGNPPLGEQGMFCISSGRPFIEKLKRAAAGASAIIAWGTCASWGCVQAARPNPTQATPIDKVITDKPIIKVPGCPPIPDVMSAIITYMVTFDRLPDVDRMGRPLMFYGQRIHDKCYRRAHFDAGEFVQSWDDDAARKGYCLYKMGCKGLPPITPVPPHAGMMAFLSQSSLVTAAWAVRKMVSGIAVRSTAAWSIFRKWVLIPPPIPSV